MARKPKPYTTTRLIVDVILTILTGGFWLIVVLIEYMRRNSR